MLKTTHLQARIGSTGTCCYWSEHPGLPQQCLLDQLGTEDSKPIHSWSEGGRMLQHVSPWMWTFQCRWKRRSHCLQRLCLAQRQAPWSKLSKAAWVQLRTETAEATSSSIIASSHISASRLPVHFPSSEPQKHSPRKKAQVEEWTREPFPWQQPGSSRRSSPRKRPSSTSRHRGYQMPPPKRDAPYSYVWDQPQSCSGSATQLFEISTAQAASGAETKWRQQGNS